PPGRGDRRGSGGEGGPGSAEELIRHGGDGAHGRRIRRVIEQGEALAVGIEDGLVVGHAPQQAQPPRAAEGLYGVTVGAGAELVDDSVRAPDSELTGELEDTRAR